MNIYIISGRDIYKYNPKCWIVFVIESNQFISKVSAVENQIARPTLLHANECNFHSTNPNEFILVGIDR